MMGVIELYNHDRGSLCSRFGWGREPTSSDDIKSKVSTKSLATRIIDNHISSTEDPLYAYYSFQPHSKLRVIVLGN
jgi:hypothetical protein